MLQRIGQNRTHQPMKPICPSIDTSLIRNEILSNFDKRIRQTAANGMAINDIAFQCALIGFVVADSEIP